MGKTGDEWLGVAEIPADCWELQRTLTGDAKIVFDVGASHGRVTGRYTEMFPNAIIYAFEPETENFRALVRRLPKLAGGDRVKCVPCAVLDYAGTVSLRVHSITDTHSVFESTQYQPAAIKTVDVKAIKLDSFCSEYGIKHIDLLKIDTEGAELLVLKGALRLLRESRIGLIYCEVSYYPYREGMCEPWEVCSFLNEHGWGLHSLWGKTNPGYRLLGGDAIFMKRDRLSRLPKSSR